MADKTVFVEGRALAFVSFATDRRSCRSPLRGMRIEHHNGQTICAATDRKIMLYARSRDVNESFDPFYIDTHQGERLIHICRDRDIDHVAFELTGELMIVWLALSADNIEIERGFIRLIRPSDIPEWDWRSALPSEPFMPAELLEVLNPRPLSRVCRAIDRYIRDGSGSVSIVSCGSFRPALISIQSTDDIGGAITSEQTKWAGPRCLPDFTRPNAALPDAREVAA
ncbi:hypothetical protein [Gluconobacter cerinus]|uniref:Uncharacterized protein n=1 Tax=Gluconobacter cerinus TaxID=38307 RepID=A0AAV5NBP2_9PROT|nr:hypothetical protein [Gluconobacter cerinus]GBR03245.1 hypothetical protein AA0229_1896 [Gluconobacter cerinus NRIC 0229]GLQ61579.1 hypothetical protein GCM10007867_04240 [Gluconobacter cerinus]